MKKAFCNSIVLLFALIAGVSFFMAACSSHVEDARDAADKSADANIDIEANIQVNFSALVLAYEDGLAQAIGLGTGATYAWYLDNGTANILPNGSACTVNTSKLSTGIHTLLVVATLDGIEYSESCTIEKE